EQAQVCLLLLGAHAGGSADERQRVLRPHLQANAGVLRAEGARAVRPRAAAAVAGRRAPDAAFWQGGVARAQAGADPGADRRVRPLADVPAGVPLQLGAVVVVAGPQRADDGEVVGALSDVLPPVGDGETAFAVLLVARVKPHEHAAAAVRRVGGD